MRVRDQTITRAALERQIVAMAPDHLAPNPPQYKTCVARRAAFSAESGGAVLRDECEQEYASLKARALNGLILSTWLLGEAADRHLPAVSSGAQSVARMIAHALASTEPKIDRKRIAAYYRDHARSFERPERRDFDIVVSLYTRRAALSALSQARRGRRPRSLWLRESLASTTELRDKKQTHGTVEAIFAASPHVLTGPVLWDGRYWVFEVTHVTPAVREPLARVAVSIEARLAAAQRRRALAQFSAAFERKWRSATSCRPGYVVRNCSEYRGPTTPQDLFAAA